MSINALVGTLFETDRQLDELLAGEVDSVSDGEGRTMLLRRAQGHLRDSEQARESEILGAISIHIVLLDPQGVIVSVNRAWQQFEAANAMGGEGHGVGANYLDFCDAVKGPNAEGASVVAAGLRAVLGGKSDTFEHEYTCNSPTQRHWFRLRVDPLGTGALRSAVVTQTDVTERVEAAEALARLSLETGRRERQFSTMLSSLSDFTYLLDREGRFVYANRPLLDLWRMTLDQIVGKSLHDIGLPPALASRLHAEGLQVFATGTHVRGEMAFDRRTGQRREYEYIFSPAVGVDGEIEFVVGLTRDITQRRQSEQLLRESAAEFRALAAAMPQIVWTTRPDGWTTFLNRQWTEYTGLTLEESLGHGWNAPFHPDDRQRAWDASQGATAGKGIYSIEARLRRADGVFRWWLVRGVPSLDGDGNILKWVGTCTDIDDLKQKNEDLDALVNARTVELNLARDQAIEANQAKSDFLATMSHEIRTPMSGLLGLLELLSLQRLEKEQYQTLEVARESGNALMHIIDDILDFSKIEANRLELAPVPTSIADMFVRIFQLHSQAASSRNLVLTCKVAPDVAPLLYFDPLRLGQVLNNFLNNAIKFTERGGVDLLVQRVGGNADTQELCFTVHDTGIGMDPKQLARLFQPFVQAAPDTSARFGGTGLGLVIARRLAHLMGGTVDMQSERGQGTTVTLRAAFPTCTDSAASVDADRLAIDALMAGRTTAPSQAQAEKEGRLLLLVDDHPTNRLLLRSQVTSLGYAAEVASDGEEALQAWATGRFGAIITDCSMPRRNGYELAAEIRRREAASGARRIPIIGCTANALRTAAEQCLSAGMDDWVVKPAGLLDISRKLNCWLPVPRFDRAQTIPAPLPVPHQPRQAAPPRSAEEEGLIDLVLLGEISAGNLQMQQALLAEFRAVNDRDVVLLREVLAGEDFKRVMQLAHRIKGAGLMLGATLLASSCGLIEVAAANRDPDELGIAVLAFEAELLRLNNYLDLLPPSAQQVRP